MRTLKELAAEAIAVQNACNVLGVSRSYGMVVIELRDRLQADGLPTDTDSIAGHVINRLWTSKLHDLAGMGLSDMDRYAEALHECERLAS